MDGIGDIEYEICGNCKKEVPHYNYVMHTAHCSRNLILCPNCKETISRQSMEAHKKKCVNSPSQKASLHKPYSRSENMVTAASTRVVEQTNRAMEKTVQRDKKIGFISPKGPAGYEKQLPKKETATNQSEGAYSLNSLNKGLLACPYCELELSVQELPLHEDYCGSRTDKCPECGELVMFKNKALHMETNHGPSSKLRHAKSSLQDSASRKYRTDEGSFGLPPRNETFTTYTGDYVPSSSYQSSTSATDDLQRREQKELYKEISRRLDCKTEYIRNLLHDSASITIPLRHNGAVPRNQFNHNKDSPRRRNPPQELLIPCEFCDTPIHHEELMEHQTGCRPDLASYQPRSRLSDSDDYFVANNVNSSEVELPCEFCSDMFPASQLLSHQATCII